MAKTTLHNLSSIAKQLLLTDKELIEALKKYYPKGDFRIVGGNPVAGGILSYEKAKEYSKEEASAAEEAADKRSRRRRGFARTKVEWRSSE